MKIKWTKLNFGEYKSKDGRFYIIRTYDVVYGNHWFLQDNNESGDYKGEYHLNSLRTCKNMAEKISAIH